MNAFIGSPIVAEIESADAFSVTSTGMVVIGRRSIGALSWTLEDGWKQPFRITDEQFTMLIHLLESGALSPVQKRDLKKVTIRRPRH